MRILEFTNPGKNIRISSKMFSNSELTLVCNNTEKGDYDSTLESQIFKCMNMARYRLAYLEVWPTKVVLIHKAITNSPTIILKKFKQENCIKELSSIINELYKEGYQSFCLTFLIDPKFHLFLPTELNKYEYRLVCALDGKAKDLLIPIIYFTEKINLFLYNHTINIYGAVRIDKNGLSYLCAYDKEDVNSICRCSRHIIRDYYETFQKAPDCLLLMDVYIGGMAKNELAHRYYGLPLIDIDLKLHGLNRNNIIWMYGYISNIRLFEKNLYQNM